MTKTHPHRIIPVWERKLQTNAFRAEIIEPQDRCSLRPKDNRARWLVQNRPFHLGQFWDSFGYCVQEPACDGCRVALAARAALEREP